MGRGAATSKFPKGNNPIRKAKSAHLANTEALASSTNFPITKAGSYRPTPFVTSCPDYADVTLVS